MVSFVKKRFGFRVVQLDPRSPFAALLPLLERLAAMISASRASSSSNATFSTLGGFIPFFLAVMSGRLVQFPLGGPLALSAPVLFEYRVECGWRDRGPFVAVTAERELSGGAAPIWAMQQ